MAMAGLQSFVNRARTIDDAAQAHELMAWPGKEMKPHLEKGRKNGK